MPVSTAWIDAFIERERLPPQFRAEIGQVLEPMAARISTLAQQRGGKLTVGLCGSQGSGKSTLATVLKELLDARGLSTAVLSIDDLYLTHQERAELAARIHPLLRTRGVPGTHDVRLGLETMARLRSNDAVELPAFDKERDDRRPRSQWPLIQGPVSIILLEGWCVGALPQDPAALDEPINVLERNEDPQGIWRRYVNAALDGEYRTLFGLLELLVLIKAPSFDVVYGWRLEQEHKLRDRVRDSGGDLSGVMSDAEVARFIGHYERITRNILAEMPARADLVLELDERRVPLRLLGA